MMMEWKDFLIKTTKKTQVKFQVVFIIITREYCQEEVQAIDIITYKAKEIVMI